MQMRCAMIALLQLAAMPAAAADRPDSVQWTRLTTPSFELFTPAGEKTGRETILQFEQVREFFLKVWPAPFAVEVPVRIVLFKTREQFAAYAANSVQIAYFTPGTKRDY